MFQSWKWEVSSGKLWYKSIWDLLLLRNPQDFNLHSPLSTSNSNKSLIFVSAGLLR